MNILVAVVVYDRFQNIKRWINCWQQSNTENAELVIVHNYYGDQELRGKFQKYSEENDIKYVPRDGPGFDIGAFQDVCRNRLPGFPDHDYLLWCCDDTIPMSKDFIKPFIDKLLDRIVGVSCMQLSKSVDPHIRTTGFCISKQLAGRINFPADPVTTKQHCYYFEHRGGRNTFTNQVRAMGLSCVAVSRNNTSPLWDSGYWKRLDRQAEHDQTFGGETRSDKVVFICPVYDMYPQIISCLICQTYQNWELLLIHNGPLNGRKYDIPEDPRVKFIVYPEATGKWGHVLRQWGLNEIRDRTDVGYVVIQNADNYLTPRYIEYLLNGFKNSHTAVATYCSDTVHSYKNWAVLPAKLERGYIDCGAVMVKKEVACEVGWKSLEHSSDWTYFSDIAKQYSWKNFKKVEGCLFVHN